MLATFQRLWRHTDVRKRNVFRHCVVMPPVCLVMILAMSLLMNEPLLVTAANQIPMFMSIALTYIGISLIQLGWPRREGDELHCAKCDYQVPPVGIKPLYCPECGWIWSDVGGVRKGRRIVRPAALYSGIAMLALVGLIFASLIFSGRKAVRIGYRLTPTNTLIDYVAGETRYLPPDVIVELFSRSLSAEQANRLAIALLDQRKRNGYMFFTRAPDWLGNYVFGSHASDELARRYHEETFPFRLSATPRRVGQTVLITMAGKTANFYGGGMPALLPDRLYVDGVEEAALRASSLQETRPDSFAVNFTPTRPGAHTIRLVALSIYYPPPYRVVSIQRDSGGEPIIPSWVMGWRRIAFETTVDVQPAK